MLKEHIDLFRALKEKSNLTNQQIADKSCLSISTINRFFRGDIDNPSFDEVNRILVAMGYSLSGLLESEVYSITRYNIEELLIPYAGRISDPYKQQISQLERDLERAEHATERANDYANHCKEVITYRRKMSTISYAINILLTAFICIILLIDILNPNVGWFRDMIARFSGDILSML